MDCVAQQSGHWYSSSKPCPDVCINGLLMDVGRRLAEEQGFWISLLTQTSVGLHGTVECPSVRFSSELKWEQERIADEQKDRKDGLAKWVSRWIQMLELGWWENRDAGLVTTLVEQRKVRQPPAFLFLVLKRVNGWMDY